MRVLLLLLLSFLPLAHADNLLDRLPSFGAKKQATFLPPDQAFGLSVTVRDAHTLLASFRVTPGYYLYRDKVSLSIKGNTAKITRINLPEGEIKQDPNFGEMHVFHQSFQAEIELDAATNVQQLTLLASYQGCAEGGICYPPIDKEIKLQLGSGRAVSAAPKAAPVATPAPTAPAPVAASAPVAADPARPVSE